MTSKGRGGRRYQPLVFTEQGVAMLSSVLRSETAVQVNVQIMRAFVRPRERFMVALAELQGLAAEVGKVEDRAFHWKEESNSDLLAVHGLSPSMAPKKTVSDYRAISYS